MRDELHKRLRDLRQRVRADLQPDDSELPGLAPDMRRDDGRVPVLPAAEQQIPVPGELPAARKRKPVRADLRLPDNRPEQLVHEQVLQPGVQRNELPAGLDELQLLSSGADHEEVRPVSLGMLSQNKMCVSASPYL